MTDRFQAKISHERLRSVALDLAVSPEAYRHKHYSAPGAGMADILLVPNYGVGNGIGKPRPVRRGQERRVLGAKRCPSCWCPGPTAPIPAPASIAAGSVLPADAPVPDQTAYIEESMLW